MQPLPRHGRGTRLAALALGLLVLLSVVAFASRGGLGRESQTAPSPGYVNYAVTVFLIVFVLMIPVAVYAYALRLREQAITARTPIRARLIGWAVRIGIACLIAFIAFDVRHGSSHLFQHLNSFHLTQTASGHGRNAAKGQVQPHFEWIVLWIAIALLAVTAAVVYRRWQAAKRGMVLRERELTMSEDLAATIDDAIDDLEAEPDARRAVIAAYARMEGALARSGLERAPSETAVEYLRRILSGLTSRGDAVSRLTSLFELAKFSQNEIDNGMKQDAIGALRTIRADLAGALG
ncbi:MAG TPA: DUF4129 domain-containing protein [Gaiellaceae bacterium]|nr:DUF4129 domain-containing protein [Gaiellaceae bacterium]